MELSLVPLVAVAVLVYISVIVYLIVILYHREIGAYIQRLIEKGEKR